MSNLKRLLLQSEGNALPMIIIFTALLIGFFLTGGILSTRKHDPLEQGFSPESQTVIVSSQGKNLQLGSFKFTSPTVAPLPTQTRTQKSKFCAPDGPKGPDCECPDIPVTYRKCGEPKVFCEMAMQFVPGTHEFDGIYGPCSSNNGSLNYYDPETGTYPPAPPTCTTACKTNDNCKLYEYCMGKPVIYLYPLVPTYIDVVLTIPGRITISDPLYPTEGWKQVLAYPSGKLMYKNREYKELYYESAVKDVVKPTTGIFIKMSELKPTLSDLTQKLGLIPIERDEFLTYWLPKLKKLDTPYIFFSVLTPEAKDAVDHVDITPAPDTKIEFLAYFKGVHSTYEINPLIIPPTPQRIGFTSVEWGGTIDY